MVSESEGKRMKTTYRGLTTNGVWVWFRSKKAIRNCKAASIICGETIIACRVGSLFDQLFWFIYPKWNRRK